MIEQSLPNELLLGELSKDDGQQVTIDSPEVVFTSMLEGTEAFQEMYRIMISTFVMMEQTMSLDDCMSLLMQTVFMYGFNVALRHTKPVLEGLTCTAGSGFWLHVEDVDDCDCKNCWAERAKEMLENGKTNATPKA